MICSTFTAKEYSWVEHRSALGRYYRNIVRGSQKSRGFPKELFLRMDWRDMTLVTGDLLWCGRLVQNILAFYENNNEKIN